MDTAVVELDALANSVRSPTENDHFSPIARVGLAFGRIKPAALVRGIHVRRKGREFSCAGVDALVSRPQIVASAAFGHHFLVELSQFAEPCIREAHFLEPQELGAILW